MEGRKGRGREREGEGKIDGGRRGEREKRERVRGKYVIEKWNKET